MTSLTNTRVNPAIVTNGMRLCITSGKSSVASAANITPAVKCCIALRMLSPSVLASATTPPSNTATTGENA